MKASLLPRYALVACLSFGSGALPADQNDPRLEPLFETLRTSSDGFELKLAELEIWSIWYEIDQPEVDARMQRGAAAAQARSLQEAEAIYGEVIELAPGFAEGWNRRATVRFYQKEYAGSLADIERTLALEPRHFGAIWGKGMILGLRRDFAGAIAAFNELQQLTPHSEKARRRLDMLQREQSRSESL